MKMHREKYLELMRKFSQELHEVGVTDSMCELIGDQCEQHPNIISTSTGPITVSKFVYRHAGYLVEAENTVKLTIKKCDP